MLDVNTKAIDFTLPDELGVMHSLSDYKGRKVVLYFYPKDNTSGCTTQANAFKDLFFEFDKDNVVVIGISKDSIKSHKNFKEKYSLPFILLSDPECKVIEEYDCYKEKSMYGKKYMGTIRTTYVIDENGTIISAEEKVSPSENAACTLKFIRNLE